jgi:O-antigen/teichoic acid export membrane protein
MSAVLIFFGGDIIVRLFNSPELQKYLWLIPISVLSSGVFLALNYWNSRTKHFGRLSVARVVSSTAAQATKLMFGFAGYVSGGILIGSAILGNFVSTLVLGGQIWRGDIRFFKTSIRWKKMISGLKSYRKFPLADIWGGLLNTVSWQLPVMLLSAFFSPIIVGYYALGNAVIRLPMNMIGGAIAQVFYQKASDAKNKGECAEIVENVYKRLVAIGLFPILLLCIIGKELFSAVFGHNWAEAGLYTQILAPWMFLTFISSPLSTLFAVFERQGSALIVHSTIFFTRLISLYIGCVLGNIFIALGLFSLTGVFVYGGLAIWNMKLANVPTYLFFSILIKYLLYFSPVGTGLLLAKFWFNVSPLIIVIVGIIASCIYLALVVREDAVLSEYLNFIPFMRRASKV